MIILFRRNKLSAIVAFAFLLTIYFQLQTSTNLSNLPRPSLQNWCSYPVYPIANASAPRQLGHKDHAKRIHRDPWATSLHLEGHAPTNRFRERLRNDTGYITSWTDGGFTNMMMTYANLIYLGMISNRVPILPPFVPYHHIDASAGILLFSEIFDLPYLRSMLRRPMVEWEDVKAEPEDDSSIESVGCWSAWATGNVREHTPRYNTLRISELLGLDISYTALPHHVRRKPDNDFDWGVLFWEVASLIYPSSGHSTLPDNLETPFKSSKGVSLLPDTQLACFDLLYFASAARDDTFEWTNPWNPLWPEVGKHMKFTDTLVEFTKDYLRDVFRVQESTAIPPFIAVHIRHGDFGGQCWQAERQEDCFAPLSAYARRVEEVQAELVQKLGITIPDHHVLVTSDETDPKFWEDVRRRRWRYIDHEAVGTLKHYGEWYITLVDMIAQSLSTGFVGTFGSTVSSISQRRVDDWNHGATRIVKWGKLGADDH